MSINKVLKSPVLITPKQEKFTIIEEKINNYVYSGPDAVGFKIKTSFGECWLSKKQFNLLFHKELF